jgi:cell division transport system permease protein
MKGYKKRSQTKEVKYVKPVKQDTRQTRIAGGNLLDKLHAHRDLHAHALFSSLGRLAASPFNSLMTIAVLAIAIALASGFHLLVANFQQLTGNIETTAQISLFLKDNVTEATANKLAERIRKNPAIERVNIISKEQALTEFKTYSGFGSAINVLKSNPLPIVLQVLPKNTLEDKQALENLLQNFRQEMDVDIAQLDLEWVERLQSIMTVAERGATLLNLMLGFAVLFIAGNTIRLELHHRRDEVIIAKLVGATDNFIQRPFLYTGFWIGFISGIVAWFIVTIIWLILRQPVETLSELYGGSYHLRFFSFTDTLKLLAISSLLGIVGSWAAVKCQLQQTKPE